MNKSAGWAYLLWLPCLAGVCGLHRFYLGRTGSAITMLVLSCTVVGLLLTVPWSIVDMVRYLMMTNGEFSERYPRKG